MGILISKTYQEITPESAEDGDFSDSGFICESVSYSFRELVEELAKYSYLSSSIADRFTWASTGFEIDDYATMTERAESIHLSHENSLSKTKYWIKALKATGLTVTIDKV